MCIYVAISCVWLERQKERESRAGGRGANENCLGNLRYLVIVRV